jgi:hypothetical protein
VRKSSVAALVALLVGIAFPWFGWGPATASPGEQYSGPYFGKNNFPPGCTRDMSPTNPENFCFHMKTDLNALDSPQVDVLIMVPVSPTAERDMRFMRQSVEMWEEGVDYLADQMGLEWLTDGVDFHVTVDYVDLQGGAGSEFTTYPVVDPEIVVIAANPTGGAGIGIDPVDFLAGPFSFTDENAVPCHNVANPFDFEYWDSLPGFDNHHGNRTGTYTEDCGGQGGNICFAVNGAIDPEPSTLDTLNLFDLVSHEFGHCLTLGHVGDGGETITDDGWGPAPANDIMSYSKEPYGLNKCVSTLDVESLAVRMSRYLDVNGDGVVGGSDVLQSNDQIGAGGLPFQVQHPKDHLYASSTGSPLDCPQPDLGLVPGDRTDWSPEPVASTEPVLSVDAPVGVDGLVDVTGTVEHKSLFEPPPPSSATGSYDDADDDATGPATEILSLDVAVTETHVDATMKVAQLWPSTAATSPVSYTLRVDGKSFDSFIRYPHEPNPKTWDGAGYMPDGTSSWDVANNTVSFHVPRDYLRGAGLASPYYVVGTANFGTLVAIVPDDFAPENGETLGVAAPDGGGGGGGAELEPGQDEDRDGVVNAADACPIHPGIGADGCTALTASHVHVFVDGALAGSEDVHAAYGPDAFSVPVTVPEGDHQLRVEWVDDDGRLLAERTISVTRPVN